ncbi:hypothetical protein Dimus_007008 [Dionaea muscipula]
MPKQFTVPPVVFPSGVTAATTATPGGGATATTAQNFQHRGVPTAPFQPQRPSSIPFMSFDMTSAASTSTSSYPPPLHHHHLKSDSGFPLFLDEPPLLEELEINPTLIWRKTKSLLNPFRINSSLHEDPDLSGPFLYYIAFGLFQLLAGKVQFGVILGWISISSIFLYTILNFLAGRNGNLDLYRCFSVVGYCLMPIVVFSAAALFFPAKGTTGFVVAGVLVAWATRVCSRLLLENSFGYGSKQVGLCSRLIRRSRRTRF